MTMRARVKPEKNWISKSKFEIENEEELLACRKIILKIVRYMKDNNMNQRDLAKKLGVSPQYINKLLHGQDLDLKITTVLRYGRILGIKLIVLPEDEPDTHQGTIQYYQFTTNIKSIAKRPAIYTESDYLQTVDYGYNSILSHRGYN